MKSGAIGLLDTYFSLALRPIGPYLDYRPMMDSNAQATLWTWTITLWLTFTLTPWPFYTHDTLWLLKNEALNSTIHASKPLCIEVGRIKGVTAPYVLGHMQFSSLIIS